ncbi:carboxy terminal-processing peptidase [Stratiformator vulcanicus]|uniref:Tail-specific protease n=1 Tax=Stratiformator vulcanicus TaxID=2527980 RepID=A0A517R4I1_9PLAN|nr:carboxy terminal-processing peptidase [Stratiformator vulcanicus]QDT38795.1 Tail-specific protease precursor [Stratiformator vulcanicus]
MQSQFRAQIAATLAVAMIVATATTIFAQGNRGDETTTVKLVASMLERYHIKRAEIDDEASKQFFDHFIDQVDPLKSYFLQSDIDEFGKFRTQLDDLVSRGDSSFAFVVYGRFLERMKNRVAYAEQLAESDFDFTKEETIIIDPDALEWARSPAELNERWRKRVKQDVLILKLEDTDETEIRDRLKKRYHNLLVTRGQIDREEILESYLSALAHAFDPHSSYMSQATLEDFRISMELSLEGIGAALRYEDGYTTVAEIIGGGAAAADGRLKAGDQIIGVAQGGEDEFVDVVEMKLNKVVKLIRGKKDTVVRLRVKKKSGGIETYDLTRQTVEIKSAAVRGEIIDTGKRLGGQSVKVGVVNIPSFYRDFRGAQAQRDGFKSTSRDVLEVLNSFDQQGGVDLVVVDLRSNGGGALTEAIEVTGLFIDKGPVVQVKEPGEPTKSHEDVDPGVAYAGPLVVLTNRLSASASEIFAAAIRDYDRGIVVGDTTTHGKGTVQNVMPVPPRLFRFLSRDESGALKLTIQQFYRVNGASTQNRGIPSDVVLPSIFDHLELGEQYLDNALAFSKIDPNTDAESLGLVSGDMIGTLKNRSQARVAADPEFAKLLRRIDRIEARKNRKTASLNEAARRAEREADEREDDQEKESEDEELTGSDKPIFPDGYYNDEVLQIGVDYVDLLNPAKTVQSNVRVPAND